MNKTVLHCIGDSHASFFSGSDVMQPVFPDVARNYIPCFRSYRVGAATAYNLVKEKSQSKGREKVFEILNSIEKGSEVLLVFGEIDCRVHVLSQVEKQNGTIDVVVEKIVDRYVTFAKEVKEKGYKVSLWGVIGSTDHVGSFGKEHEYPAVGSMVERNKVTKLFNEKLEKKAKKFGLGFVSIFDSLVNKEFVTNKTFYTDEVHLSQKVMLLAIKKIEERMDIICLPLLSGVGKYLPKNFQKNIFELLSTLRTKKRYKRIQHITMKHIMKKVVKTIIEKIPGLHAWKQMIDWRYRLKGKGAPPHSLKQRNILSHKKKHNTTILVETGTFKGDMIEAMKRKFDTLYSIELDDELYAAAKERFKDDSHVTLFHGDSGEKMSEVLTHIKSPALFWLDGHYSGGITASAELVTPIKKELEAIFSHSVKNHVILIDDARLFVGEDDYPTMEEMETFIKSNRSDARIAIKDDAICITFE